MHAGYATEVVSVADDHRGGDQDKKADKDQIHRFAAGSVPFVKEDSPNRAKNDD